MAFTTDLVAFSGLQHLEKVPYPGVGQTLNTDMLTGFDTALLAAGWTKIVDGATDKTYISQKSPWYLSVEPSWYDGARVSLRVRTVSSNRLQLLAGGYYAGAVESQMLGTFGNEFISRPSTFGARDFYILACPYQVFWFVHNPVFAAADTAVSGFASVLQVPDRVQQGQAVVSRVYASHGWNGESGGLRVPTTVGDYVYMRNKGDVSPTTRITSSSGAAASTMIPTLGSGHGKNVSGRRIFNRALDTTMADATKWSGFWLPAQMAFTSVGKDATTMHIRGFLWDAIVIAEAFTLGTILEFESRRWIMLYGARVSGANPSSLFVLMGDDTVTL
jgi:hypothetical protein